MAAVLTTLAALAPERGLAASAPVVMAAPAARPDVPEPAAGPADLSPAAPITGAAPAVAVPVQIPASAIPAGGPQLAYSAWASRLSWVTGIPVRALEAYAYAHAVLATSRPGCQLSWTTLAGIAAVESQHGTIGGRTLLADGRPSAPIIGIALNGANGTRAIAATDAGRLTGDKTWERAVGPFQFIPSAWAIWRTDAHGDGMTDPQNIDNAALAAAKYLCADNHNLASGQDWLRAILSYNNSLDYARTVYGYAQAYARRAQAISWPKEQQSLRPAATVAGLGVGLVVAYALRPTNDLAMNLTVGACMVAFQSAVYGVLVRRDRAVMPPPILAGVVGLTRVITLSLILWCRLHPKHLPSRW
jgi:membrane-bound lytic murein transglycosylase B